MTDILTITANPALDLSIEAPAVIPDVKLRCSLPRTQPGGGGVNVSRAIAKLGGKSRTLVAYGGATGQMLVELLRAEGLTPEPLGVEHETRQSLSVTDATSRLQYRFMMPGPPWSPSDCAAARQVITAAIRPGALVVPSGSHPPGMPEDFYLDLATGIAKGGGRLMLDTSGKALTKAAAAGADIFALRMDLEEARDLSGQDLLEIEDIADLATALRHRKAAAIVMIAAGALGTVIDCGTWRGQIRPPVVEPVSKIGAGDSFVGAFALSISRGDDPVTACEWGTAAAAAAVTQAGTDLCDRAMTERLLARVERVPV